MGAGAAIVVGGVETAGHRTALNRDWRPIALSGGEVRVKVGVHHGLVTVVNPNSMARVALARLRGVPARHVLDGALADAAALGLRAGVSSGNERPDRFGASP